MWCFGSVNEMKTEIKISIISIVEVIGNLSQTSFGGVTWANISFEWV